MCSSRSPRSTGGSATSGSRPRRWRTSTRLSSGEGGDNEKLIFEVLRRGLPPEVPAGHVAARARRPGAAVRPDRAADPVLREQPRVAADAVPVVAGGAGVAGGPAAAGPVPAVLPVRHRHDRRAVGAGRGGADRGDDRGAGRDRADRDDDAAVGPAVPGRAGGGLRGARGGAGRVLHHRGQAGQDRLGRGAGRAGGARVRPGAGRGGGGEDPGADRRARRTSWRTRWPTACPGWPAAVAEDLAATVASL